MTSYIHSNYSLTFLRLIHTTQLVSEHTSNIISCSETLAHTHPILPDHFRTMNDEVVPQQPKEVVHCEGSK